MSLKLCNRLTPINDERTMKSREDFAITLGVYPVTYLRDNSIHKYVDKLRFKLKPDALKVLLNVLRSMITPQFF